MTLLLLTTLFSTNPVELTSTERVDAFERNHLFCEHGKPVFIQLIFWAWRPCESTHRVAAWRMEKNEHLIPYRDWQRGGYSVLWLDGDVVRLVNAETYEESWSQTDPELIDRCSLPRERRRELRTNRITVE